MAAEKTLLLILCVSVLLVSAAVGAKERCNPQDKKALLQLKKDLNNPYVLASWNPDEDCCTWYCVECDSKTNRIITFSIYLSVPEGKNFTAQIPNSIAGLPYLQTLELHHLPYLTGPLNPAIAKLTNLNFIRITRTNISGPVPAFLGQLKNLNFLDLSFNNLTGSIPPELAQLPKLETLHLDRNHLTGPIPPSFGSFKSNNPYVYLSHNNLSGPIPPSFLKLNFTTLDLSRNKLVGDASGLFGADKGTQTIDLSRNQFAFDLSKVKFPKTLIYLDLNHNKIYGEIPAQLTSLDLQFLNVSYNRLCGKIPVGGRLQDQDVYSYLHNKCLCGSPLPNNCTK
ncbi:hypothetical protein PIB30_028828 [Stylosanthes scabra]|uniref:Leucine-rich repeat-containing N-terminal plant-type domain-containing protein n=1 Tax=Stylosanthes scabra TaxID=79078 RepID=A0ABU6UCV2_9FABA|nr:hypothetical protein [Stylosanthes scabra]